MLELSGVGSIWCNTGVGGIRKSSIWVVLQIRVPFRVLVIRVPYYFWDLKRAQNLENYPYIVLLSYTQESYSNC